MIGALNYLENTGIKTRNIKELKDILELKHQETIITLIVYTSNKFK